MDSNKDKKILHLLENIDEKLGEVTDKVNSGPLKKELNDYKDHFKQAGARIKKGHEFK